MMQPLQQSMLPLPVTERRVWRHPRANRHIELSSPDGPHGKLIVCVAYLYEVAQRRSIGMSITREGLRVRAPRWVSQSQIDACLRQRAGWILRALHQHQQPDGVPSAPALVWAHGMWLDYQGQPLQLQLGYAGRTPLLQPASAAGQLATLHLPLALTATPSVMAACAQKWLRAQALALMQQRVAFFAPQMGVQPQRVALTAARTRWGSASSRGSIRLHWRLVQMPPQVLDYVVIHELAHLHEMNHGPRFWAWVEHCMPDYRHWRKTLQAMRLPEWDAALPQGGAL